MIKHFCDRCGCDLENKETYDVRVITSRVGSEENYELCLVDKAELRDWITNK